MMNVKPLKTNDDYEAALARIDEWMDAEVGSSEGDELEVLSVLVENYEDRHHSIDAPDPIAAIRFQMEQYGLRDKDLIPLIGSSGRVSEVLSYKRKLTLRMIRNLETELNIPAQFLIKDYELRHAK